ncbi:MAG: hypothetical protein M1832_004540 [Thelocarpon impressellum]|nr:MAG: hypothetical protein M1832_004540 [Thelocarpon impressellum]
MTEITAQLNGLLKQRDASGIPPPRTRSSTVDGFLKEAYRINSHIASLRTYLRSIRQAYLSTSLPTRRTPLSRANSTASARPQEKERVYFTDTQRDQIDAESKQLLRELNASIRNLADAEEVRQRTEATVAQRRRARNGLGVLGRWAAGGVGVAMSPEEEVEEARAGAFNMHRESVLWYLRRRLGQCGEVQRAMMETRLVREVEKSKSVLYKTHGVRPTVEMAEGTGMGTVKGPGGQWAGGRAVHMDELEKSAIEQQLSPEQLQLFARENQDMLKHYEETLDQVRTAERSLVEISELQSVITGNLATQSAHIDQLVADSLNTEENVGGGNRQLKKAAERASTAKYVFYGSCAFSLLLVVYDLLI